MTARELRFSFVVEDLDEALGLFRDAFGLETLEAFEEAGRGVLLRVPEATLELLDPEHAAWVDGIETGARREGRVRIAVRVDDLDGAGEAATTAGASAVADPVETPWGDRNRRYRTADGLQLTLFQPPG